MDCFQQFIIRYQIYHRLSNYCKLDLHFTMVYLKLLLLRQLPQKEEIRLVKEQQCCYLLFSLLWPASISSVGFFASNCRSIFALILGRRVGGIGRLLSDGRLPNRSHLKYMNCLSHSEMVRTHLSLRQCLVMLNLNLYCYKYLARDASTGPRISY